MSSPNSKTKRRASETFSERNIIWVHTLDNSKSNWGWSQNWHSETTQRMVEFSVKLISAFLVMLMGYPFFVLGYFSTHITNATEDMPHVPNEDCLSKSSLLLWTQLDILWSCRSVLLCVEGKVLKQGSWTFASWRQKSQAVLKNPFAILEIKPLLLCAEITYVLGAIVSHWWCNSVWFASTLLSSQHPLFRVEVNQHIYNSCCMGELFTCEICQPLITEAQVQLWGKNEARTASYSLPKLIKSKS